MKETLVKGICLSHKIKVTYCLVKIQSLGSKTRVTSPGHGPERWYMEAVCCPDCMASYSSIPARSKGIQDITFGANLAA